MAERHTVLVTSALARAELEIRAARERAHGRQILSPAQAAARLAGGFLQPVARDALLDAMRACLDDASVALGGLDAIRALPGTARAAAAALERAWVAGFDLAQRAQHEGAGRLRDMAALEAEVLRRLPAGMLRAPDLVRRALARLDAAPRVLGPITLRGIPDLDPVWRPLLPGLAAVVPVRWDLGHFEPPAWIDATGVEILRSEPCAPSVQRVSCANPRHEALEALRWARALIASGEAPPEAIAIVAPASHEWDEHLAVLAADASLPLAFLHGRPALATADGQAAAALADVLLSGLGQSRVRRLLALLRGATAASAGLPADWHRILPADAPLLELARWEQVIDEVQDWPGGRSFAEPLRALLRLLAGGTGVAADAGERLLAGRALSIWRKALREGPASALDATLGSIRVDDGADACTSIVWCSAADAAAWPRPNVRLLGLTSRGWPRSRSEDPLLPAHLVDPALLDPVPLAERDRRDFHTLLRAPARQVVLSRARRDGGGRRSGESALPRQAGAGAERSLWRGRVPAHAASEADRLLARPDEFAASPAARRAVGCWRDWHRAALTAHDGLLPADHPAIREVLAGRFSATSLQRLARDPLGFVWQYVLGWKARAEDEEPLGMDPVAFGSLLHRMLELATRDPALEGAVPGADAGAITGAITGAVARATQAAREETERAQPVPPRLLWHRILEQASALAVTALAWEEAPLPGQRSYCEVPFGGVEDVDEEAWPWDPARPVTIPGAGLAIGGRIDRIDIAGDGSAVRVTDYKSGRPPKEDTALRGGAELQRCLYAFAARALLGDGPSIEARLLYPRTPAALLPLAAPDAVLERLSWYLGVARDHLRDGLALVGPGSGEYGSDPLTFALPANAGSVYLVAKRPLAAERLAPLPELWAMP